MNFVLIIFLTMLFVFLLSSFFLIKKKLFDRIIIDNVDTFSINIDSDKVIILSKENCPWCKELSDKIEGTKTDYVKINENSSGTFTFDSKFLNLDKKERKSILDGITEITNKVGYIFPTIIYKTKYTLGLPPDDILYKIFVK